MTCISCQMFLRLKNNICGNYLKINIKAIQRQIYKINRLKFHNTSHEIFDVLPEVLIRIINLGDITETSLSLKRYSVFRNFN